LIVKRFKQLAMVCSTAFNGAIVRNTNTNYCILLGLDQQLISTIVQNISAAELQKVQEGMLQDGEQGVTKDKARFSAYFFVFSIHNPVAYA